MPQYTVRYEIRITPTQKETLKKLETNYKINVSQFIRAAIREKILREWPLMNKPDNKLTWTELIHKYK